MKHPADLLLEDSPRIEYYIHETIGGRAVEEPERETQVEAGGRHRNTRFDHRFHIGILRYPNGNRLVVKR